MNVFQVSDITMFLFISSTSCSSFTKHLKYGTPFNFKRKYFHVVSVARKDVLFSSPFHWQKQVRREESSWGLYMIFLQITSKKWPNYPSSHNHGSGKWVPPIFVSFHLGWLSTSIIMGERVMSKATISKGNIFIEANHQFSRKIRAFSGVSRMKLHTSQYAPCMEYLPTLTINLGQM